MDYGFHGDVVVAFVAAGAAAVVDGADDGYLGASIRF